MSKNKITNEILDIAWNEINPLNILKKYVIEIGVWDTSFDRELLEDKSKKSSESSVKKGVSNAQLMYIHEFGSPVKNIPARPVLQKTIDWGYKRLNEYYLDLLIKGVLIDGWKESEIEKYLNQLALEMEAHCKKMTQQNKYDLVKLSKKTINQRRKHSDVPLYDTGQLIKSIRCRVVKI